MRPKINSPLRDAINAYIDAHPKPYSVELFCAELQSNAVQLSLSSLQNLYSHPELASAKLRMAIADKLGIEGTEGERALFAKPTRIAGEAR